MKKLLIIHGPNLNLLGKREVSIYGKTTIKAINQALMAEATKLKIKVDTVQSNHEGEIVDRIQEAGKKYDGIVINPAAYTHTSVAIRDALSAVSIPAIEVHLSHIAKREDFRQKSITAPACIGQICGFGAVSYLLGIRAMGAYLQGHCR